MVDQSATLHPVHCTGPGLAKRVRSVRPQSPHRCWAYLQYTNTSFSFSPGLFLLLFPVHPELEATFPQALLKTPEQDIGPFLIQTCHILGLSVLHSLHTSFAALGLKSVNISLSLGFCTRRGIGYGRKVTVLNPQKAGKRNASSYKINKMMPRQPS